MLTAQRHATRRTERGTVLLLFPVALLVVLILAAVAVDAGQVYVRAREVQAVASSLADDSLAALDLSTLRSTGEVRLDPARVDAIAREGLARSGLPEARVVSTDIGTDALGRLEVSVTVAMRVDYVIAPALPGQADHVEVVRTGTAVVLG